MNRYVKLLLSIVVYSIVTGLIIFALYSCSSSPKVSGGEVERPDIKLIDVKSGCRLYRYSPCNSCDHVYWSICDNTHNSSLTQH